MTIQKFDPVYQYDPGTMSPYQHGGSFCHRRWCWDRLRPLVIMNALSISTPINTQTLSQQEKSIARFFLGRNAMGILGSNGTGDSSYWQMLWKKRSTSSDDDWFRMSSSQLLVRPASGYRALPFLEALRQMKADVGAEMSCISIPPSFLLEGGGWNENQTNLTLCERIDIQPNMLISVPQSLSGMGSRTS